MTPQTHSRDGHWGSALLLLDDRFASSRGVLKIYNRKQIDLGETVESLWALLSDMRGLKSTRNTLYFKLTAFRAPSGRSWTNVRLWVPRWDSNKISLVMISSQRTFDDMVGLERAQHGGCGLDYERRDRLSRRVADADYIGCSAGCGRWQDRKHSFAISATTGEECWRILGRIRPMNIAINCCDGPVTAPMGRLGGRSNESARWRGRSGPSSSIASSLYSGGGDGGWCGKGGVATAEACTAR